MSLPAGFLDELRSRVSLSQVIGRKVIWDPRKSNQGKGDMWAPCPFHQEKTASFHVDDRKGFYYCFGCHAKGDVITFLRESENMGFMEAVELLAKDAGMPMPQRDPRAKEKADRRDVLADVMDQAVQHYRLQLKTAAAGAARDYLARRGLDEAVQERFEIGFAPDARQGVFQHLTGKGVAADLVVDAGLAARPDDGGAPYDRFRGRIMFPIRDARGRCIAFGGRSMDPNARAKYLNSPDTELFDKSRVLFNHGPAREAAGKGKPLVAAEGYMDVIALASNGFEAAVAPLGTAVTETQLDMLWRIAPEPVLALDGDKAGLRAAMRVIDIALPKLEAGQSLRFALMPLDKDPDDLIRAEGAAAFQSVLDRAMPMVQLLWQRETEGKVFDSPERRAGLDKALREKIRLIRDPSIRRHYGEEVNRLRWALFRGNTRSGRPWRGRRQAVEATPLPSTKSSLLVAAGDDVQHRLREAVILAAILSCPEILHEFEGRLDDRAWHDAEFAVIAQALLRHADATPDTLRALLEGEIGPAPLENLMALSHVAITPCVRNPGDAEMARMTVEEELAKLDAERGLAAEIREAEQDLEGLADEAVTWRLGKAAEARHQADRKGQEDKAEYDVGDNGARINRDERSAFEALIDKIQYAKPDR